MSPSDPTDDALAAIASILDHPAETLAVKTDDTSLSPTETTPDERTSATSTAPAAVLPMPEQINVDNYVKIGPGPLDAIRFRWAARRDGDGQYYVDETIGLNSRPMTTGPIPRRDVIDFINAKASAAQRRFDALRSEMTLSGHAPDDRSHESES